MARFVNIGRETSQKIKVVVVVEGGGVLVLGEDRDTDQTDRGTDGQTGSCRRTENCLQYSCMNDDYFHKLPVGSIAIGWGGGRGGGGGGGRERGS